MIVARSQSALARVERREAVELQRLRDALAGRPRGRRLSRLCDTAAIAALTPRRQVSIVIPSAGTLDEFGAALVEGTLELVAGLATTYVVVTNGNLTPEGREACDRYGARIVEVSSDGFNFSRAINAGVAATSTRMVLLLNDDVRGPVAAAHWLPRWLARMSRLSCVALQWPDRRTAYGGINWNAPGHMPAHQFLGAPPESLPPEPATLAVTGAAMLVDRRLFEQLGGFCEDLPLNYNDIDFCVQALRHGTCARQFNDIVLTHKESASRGSTPPTVTDYRVFAERCADTLAQHGVAISADDAIATAGL